MNDKVLKIVHLHEQDRTVTIKKGHLERDWMDNTVDNHAYRCLPLNIANQHGWAVYPNSDITFVWNGTNDHDCIKFLENSDRLGASVFGNGIVTFSMPFLVRTPENYSIYITGMPNHHVNSVNALTGVYESDWAPYSFTMNWQVTDPYKPITFTESDPLCFFFPIHRDLIEQFELKNELLEQQDFEYRKQYYTFNYSREKFLAEGNGGWQKHYFQGKLPDESKCPVSNHKTKLNLKDPV